MSLRARLIWAFFLLAVVPLCGVTLSSYLTTEKAYRRAVEDETAALAEEMNGRLGSVTRDLGRRLEGLSELPFGAVSAGKDQPEAMDKLLADVRSQIGDAASLVEALEFRPSAPEPAASPGRARTQGSGRPHAQDAAATAIPGGPKGDGDRARPACGAHGRAGRARAAALDLQAPARRRRGGGGGR